MKEEKGHRTLSTRVHTSEGGHEWPLGVLGCLRAKTKSKLCPDVCWISCIHMMQGKEMGVLDNVKHFINSSMSADIYFILQIS